VAVSGSHGLSIACVCCLTAARRGLRAGGNDNLAIQMYPGNTSTYVAAIGTGFSSVIAELSGNGAMPVWVMPNLRSYFGAPPVEGIGNFYFRNKRLGIIAALPYARVGSLASAVARTPAIGKSLARRMCQLPAYYPCAGVSLRRGVKAAESSSLEKNQASAHLALNDADLRRAGHGIDPVAFTDIFD